MKKIIFCFLFLTSINLLSQNHVDALRYSYLEPLGTARYTALAGSFSSLGGDLSSIHQNPAGMGIYRTDEVGFTLSTTVTANETEYFNNSFQNEQGIFYIQNMGYVKTLRQNENKWNRFSVGVTYNRLKDFNQQITILGSSNESRINTFLNNAEGISPENLYENEYLAYQSYLIDENDNNYTSYIDYNTNDLSHQNVINQSGYIDELSLSMSGAYNDLLFVGLQLGFQGINYQELNSYKESGFTIIDDYDHGDIADIGPLNEFIYSQNLNVVGGGLNYKLGLIVKPTKFLRFGAAYHSKTHFEIEENWQSSMTSYFGDTIFHNNSPYGFGNYTLETPSKTISSLALIIAKRGLINIEVEQIDYSSSKLDANYYNFLEENSNISNIYKKTTNIRMGAECRFGDINFRAGIGIYESPFSSNSIELDPEERIVQSFGVGYRSNQYFFDCAIINAYEKQEYFMFNGSSATEISKSRQGLIFSVGYKF